MTIQQRMFQLETDLILNTIRHLQKGNLASAEWGVKKLSEIGALEKSNIKLINSTLKQVNPQLIKELENAQLLVDKSVKSMIDITSWREALPLSASPQAKAILSSFEAKAIGDISKTGSTMIQYLSKKYEETIQQVITEKLLTGESIRTAINKTGKELAKQGVPALIDKAGRQWSLEAYSQMVVRANVKQVATQTQFERFNEYGVDLVEVSSHMGARPLCEPYQGYVFSMSGTNPNYPAFSSTSYGEPAGLLGINCGHKIYPYTPGTKKTYEPYPKRENDKVYKESQEQRKLERDIRSIKSQKKEVNRQLAVAKQVDDKQGIRLAQETLKSLNERQAVKTDELKSFLTKTERTRRADRERLI